MVVDMDDIVLIIISNDGFSRYRWSSNL